MTIRISLATVIVAVIFAAVGAGVTVGVMLWEPWDGGYERRFTGAEAAEFVHVSGPLGSVLLQLWSG